jgi:hypothetical protein
MMQESLLFLCLKSGKALIAETEHQTYKILLRVQSNPQAITDFQ